MERISLSTVDYLVFEGGGGKGIIYLGAVQALEEIIQSKLFPIDQNTIEERPFRGISGASAGAIISFMLALGMSATDILNELIEDPLSMDIYPIIENGRKSKSRTEAWSQIESLFEQPDSNYRTVKIDKKLGFSVPGIKDFQVQVSSVAAWKKTMSGFYRTALNWFVGYTKLLYNFAIKNNITKRLFLIGDYNSEILSSTSASASGPLTGSFPVEVGKFVSHNHLAAFAYATYYHRGLFSGIAARKYFQKLLKSKLERLDKQFNRGEYFSKQNKSDLSFREFYNLTGVDLVLSSVNLTKCEPRYFSVWHTPDFPVAEAVTLSISIPFIFRPGYVEGGALIEDPEYDKLYKGMYIDGGVHNNFPVRAFDTVLKKGALKDSKPVLFRNQAITAYLAVDWIEGTEGNERFLGFRLADLGEKAAPSDWSVETETLTEFPVDPDGQKRIFLDYLTAVVQAVLYPGSKGQVRFKNDRQRTIELNSHGWGLLDFQHPVVTLKNAQSLNNQKLYADANRLVHIATEIKMKRLNDASAKVRHWVLK